MTARWRHAFSQRANEILIPPFANALDRIGGYVGTIESAERRLKRPAPGEKRAFVFDVRMASSAAPGMEQVFAALYPVRILGAGWHGQDHGP